ncbi:hypothetical protein ACH4GK_22030 [Streptomyces rimosus]|uniref:hypothetical protein n=1 Tax=Streptomyces rimosus TaxID=1927 RepID=UPI001F40678D|nr:hypothetical protein [Streptomyces rimosus]
MREHIEAAMKGRTKAEHRIKQAGRGASAASLATDLALVHEEDVVTKLHAGGEFGGS